MPDFGALIGPRNILAKPVQADEEGDGLPGQTAPHKRKNAGAIRMAALAEARQVLGELPGPGESLHAIMTGRYDMVDVIDALAPATGIASEMRIATLSFSHRNTARMEDWIATGRVQRLTILCSLFFIKMNPAVYQGLFAVIQKAGPPHRLAASRNHCKVICLDCPDTGKWIIEGSANLRTNSNEEQFALFRDPGLCDWHSAWIEDRVSTYAARGTSD
jgi:hypothetical protein